MSAIASPIIDEVAVGNLLTAFYLRLRRDHLLAPVFEHAVGKTDAEWAAHLAHLRDFWSSVMLTSGRCRGNRIRAHPRLPDLEPAMFERWLWLFGGTCTDLFEPWMASAFQDRAGRIAKSMRRALARNGNIHLASDGVAGTAITYMQSASVHQEIAPHTG